MRIKIITSFIVSSPSPLCLLDILPLCGACLIVLPPLPTGSREGAGGRARGVGLLEGVSGSAISRSRGFIPTLFLCATLPTEGARYSISMRYPPYGGSAIYYITISFTYPSLFPSLRITKWIHSSVGLRLTSSEGGVGRITMPLLNST